MEIKSVEPELAFKRAKIVTEVKPKLTLPNIALLIVLCIINALNYMDRYMTAALFPRIQYNFDLTDAYGGILHASYMLIYLIFMPFSMHMSNDIQHRTILRNSCIMWLMLSTASGFSSRFGVLLYMRLLVAACQASFSAVAAQVVKTLVAQLHHTGPKWLLVYYISGPVGAGFGFMLSACLLFLLDTTLAWRFSFWLTPALLLCNLPFLYFFGNIRHPTTFQRFPSRAQSMLLGCWQVMKIPSFSLATAGFVCTHIFTSAFFGWLPTYFYRSFAQIEETLRLPHALFILGSLIVVSSIIGFLLGAWTCQMAYKHGYKYADPIMCGVGLLTSLPCLGLTLFNVSTSIYVAMGMASLSQLALSFYGSVENDMLLYVIPLKKRPAAWLANKTLVHLWGDALGSLMIGIISTNLFIADTNLIEDENARALNSLQRALSGVCLFQLLGGIFFFSCIPFIANDRKNVQESAAEPSHSSKKDDNRDNNFITVRSLYELSNLTSNTL